jgi:hypothetical protein
MGLVAGVVVVFSGIAGMHTGIYRYLYKCGKQKRGRALHLGIYLFEQV